MAKRRNFHGSIDRRGATFRVRFGIEGRRYSFSVPTTDRRIAEIAAINKYAQLAKQRERRAAGIPDIVRISTVITEFEKQIGALTKGTQRAYNDSLKPIRQFFIDRMGDPTVEKIRARDIDAYTDWRRTHRLQGRRNTDGGPVGNRSLNKDRTILHLLFGLAERREYVASNPVRRTNPLQVDAHNPIILTNEEYDRLLEAAASEPMLHLYVLLLGETGMRCESEALHLRWEDVSFESGFITVVSGREGHRTKSGRTRVVPMTPKLVVALRAHFATYRFAAQTPYIFHHEHTRRHSLAGERVGTMRGMFRRAAKSAKLSSRFRQHDLRHRRVTAWLAEGKSAVLVMQAMGHSRLETTMGYYKYLPEHLRALVSSEPTMLIQASGHRYAGPAA
jgi:integrase